MLCVSCEPDGSLILPLQKDEVTALKQEVTALKQEVAALKDNSVAVDDNEAMATSGTGERELNALREEVRTLNIVLTEMRAEQAVTETALKEKLATLETEVAASRGELVNVVATVAALQTQSEEQKNDIVSVKQRLVSEV